MADADPRSATTLTEMMRRRTALTPEKLYFELYGETVTYRRLWEQSGRFAAALVRAGLTKDAPVELRGHAELMGAGSTANHLASGDAMGRQIGQARPEARIDVPLQDFRGRVDVCISVECARAVSHGLLRWLLRNPEDRRHLAELPPQLAPGVTAIVAAIQVAVTAGREDQVGS